MRIQFFFLFSSFLYSLTTLGQAQDSLLRILQKQVRELKIQRSQDSLKVNVLSEELKSLLLLDTQHAETSKDSLYKK